MIVSAPMDELELRNLMYTAQLEKIQSPFSIRYPRGRGMFKDWKRPFEEIEIGKSRLISEGNDTGHFNYWSSGKYCGIGG